MGLNVNPRFNEILADALERQKAEQEKEHIADISKMDLIRRTDALFILYDFAGCIVDTPGGHYRKAYEAYRRKLETLPAIQPKRGRWKGEGLGDYRCSLCGEVQTRTRTNYCPNCGAQMEKGEDDD